MPFSNCASFKMSSFFKFSPRDGKNVRTFTVYRYNYGSVTNRKNVRLSCEREADRSHFSPLSNCASIVCETAKTRTAKAGNARSFLISF